jgi:DNA-binding transcriptional MocR family regulator
MPLPYAMVQSPAWRTLSGAAVKVWIELRARYNKYNNGRLTLSVREAADLLGIGDATAWRAFQELQGRGFICLRKRGRWYGRQASEWESTDLPVDGKLATRDWNNWRPSKTDSRFSGGIIADEHDSVTVTVTRR